MTVPLFLLSSNKDLFDHHIEEIRDLESQWQARVLLLWLDRANR